MVITHLVLMKKNTQSLRTTIPRSIVQQLKLERTDMLQWLENKEGDIVVKKLKVE